MRFTGSRDKISAAILRGARFEIIPLRSVLDEVEFLPRGTTVTVTGSPRRGIDATLELSEQLVERGFHTVPHIMSRLVRNREHLSSILNRLDSAGLDEVFVIGGDVPAPAGNYDSAGALIADMVQMEKRPKLIGIAAYPEGHPLISSQMLIKALLDKQPYAAYMVTQICFDPDLIFRWLTDMRAKGITLPVYFGIPGILNRSRLLEISLRVGVGQSTRFLTNHIGLIARLLSRDIYKPDRLVSSILKAAAGSQCNIAGLHIYTFNQCQATERWRQKAAGLRSL